MSSIAGSGALTTTAMARLELLDAVEAALTYDYLQNRGAQPDTPAGIVREYITDRFLDEILVRRRAVNRLRTFIGTGEPTLLIGAPGSGKTAALLGLNAELRKARTNHGSPYLMIAFNGNKNAFELRSRRDIDTKTDYIIGRLANAISRRFFEQLGSDLSNEWRKVLLNDRDFNAFRQTFGQLSPPDLDELLRTNITAAAEWASAFREFERRAPIDRIKPMVEVLSDTGCQLVLAIDNCDQLSNKDLMAAMRATRDTHQLTSHGLALIVAIRPTTKKRITSPAGYGPYRSVFLNTFEEYPLIEPTETMTEETREDLRQDLEQARSVFDPRLRVFSDPVLLDRIEDSMRKRGAPSKYPFRSDIARISRTMTSIWEDYFSFRGEQHGGEDQNDEDLTSAFLSWHNGSLREIARSIVHYATRYIGGESPEGNPVTEELMAEALESADSPLSPKDGIFEHGLVRNKRTILFRHLIFFGTPREDVANRVPMMHESLRIFGFDESQGSLEEFPFLHSRILQYLHTRRSRAVSPTFGNMTADFAQFGFPVEELHEAVLELAIRQSFESGLIRVGDLDSESIMERYATSRIRVDDDAELELLPAGEFLISRLCHVVEFLYWSAVTDATSRARVALSLGVHPDVLVEQSYYNRVARRCEVAISYVRDVLIPRFEAEHPYMAPGHKPSQAECARLRAFCRLFGFGVDNWHLSRALRQIQRYRSPRHGGGYNVNVSVAAEKRISEIQDRITQLNRVYRLHES